MTEISASDRFGGLESMFTNNISSRGLRIQIIRRIGSMMETVLSYSRCLHGSHPVKFS